MGFFQGHKNIEILSSRYSNLLMIFDYFYLSWEFYNVITCFLLFHIWQLCSDICYVQTLPCLRVFFVSPLLSCQCIILLYRCYGLLPTCSRQ